MPDQLDPSGLQVKTLSEIVSDLTTGLQAIFGSDINVDQNTPDGQLINIFAQAARDLRELLVQVYNSFDPDSAFGVTLDSRVALNGIQRKTGTFTITPVSITVDRALTLDGLDTNPSNPFTVQDDGGNQFQLITHHAFSGAGTTSLQFQAALVGQVLVTLNSITQQVTNVLGVTAVNNPSAPTQIGSNEESDVALKIRRGRSFYLANDGAAQAVADQLLNIPDVQDAFVGENPTGSGTSDVSAHSIHVVVRGGTNAEIAAAIYAKRPAGCGMDGAVTFNVSRPNAQTAVMKWDVAVAQPLKIRFGVTATSGQTPTNTAIQNALSAFLSYRLGQIATIGDTVAAMLQLFPNVYLTAPAVSGDGGSTWGDTASPTDIKHYFTVAAGDITIL